MRHRTTVGDTVVWYVFVLPGINASTVLTVSHRQDGEIAGCAKQ